MSKRANSGDDFEEDVVNVKRQKPTVDGAKRTPLPPKAARKAEKKVAKKVDGRSKGRDNDYVIMRVTEDQRETIWREVMAKKLEVDRSDEKLPMSNCWTYGSRKGYSYYSLGHGKSQLKLTQLAIWNKFGEVCMISFCHM